MSDMKFPPPASFTEKAHIKSLEQYQEMKLRIEGHTDDSGNEEHNLELSEQRAKTVLSYFLGQGISSGRLSSEGYGATVPIADNGTEEGRAANRRVAFVGVDQ